MRLRWIPAVLLSLALVAGCGGDDDDGGESGGTTTTGSSDTPEVELLSAGDQPRSELRLDLEPGRPVRVAMTVELDIRQTIAGQPSPPVDLPASRMVMAATVEKVSDNGEATVETVIEEADIVDTEGVDPQVAKAMRDGMKPFVGYRVTVVMDDRGRVLDTDASEPEGLPAEVEQLVQQLNQQLATVVIPLPEEAVGKGARWKVTTPVKVSGIEVEQTSTATLVELSDGIPVLRTELDQAAEPGPAELPGVPSTVDVELVSWNLTGSGEARQDLSSPLPISGSSKVAGDQRFQFTDGTETADLVQHLAVDLTIERL